MHLFWGRRSVIWLKVAVPSTDLEAMDRVTNKGEVGYLVDWEGGER